MGTVRGTPAILGLALPVLLALLFSHGAQGQGRDEAAPGLLRLLTHKSDATANDIVFTCGISEEDRKRFEAAKSLAGLGASAVPAIEEALESIDKGGIRSEYATDAGLILSAYAQIEGSAAYRRLSLMIDNPDIGFLQPALDSSVAIALNLTSYVSFRPWTRMPAGLSGLCGDAEPRESLNELILAWEGDSRPLLEENLGSRAKAALQALLGGRTWAEMRAEAWGDKSRGSVGVGYRFDIQGDWARPPGDLVEAVGGPNPFREASAFELGATFKNAAGADCGTDRLDFAAGRVAGDIGPVKYAVNNADLGGLLRLIASCGSQTSKTP